MFGNVDLNFAMTQMTLFQVSPRRFRFLIARMSASVGGSERDLSGGAMRTFGIHVDRKCARGSSARDKSMIPPFDRAYVPRARDAIVQR